MASINCSMQNTQPLHTSSPLYSRSIEQVFTSYKSGFKTAVFGTAALLGTAGIYCASKYFNASSLPIKVEPQLDMSQRIVRVRAIPTALPLEDQVAVPGAFFQVSHEFFTEANGGFIEQKMTRSPSWLTSQLNPVASSYNTFGNALGVQVVGNIAYVPNFINVKIINVTSSSTPTLISTYTGAGMGVQVIGNIAYVANGTGGLAILNIATPSSPTLIGTYNTPGSAFGIQIVGTTAYVADDTSGLQIINVATPSSPTLIGTYDTPGSARAVQVIGTTAYVADYTSGLHIINIAMPSNPTLIGTYNIPTPTVTILGGWTIVLGAALGIQVIGTTAYVPFAGNGLKIINITTPNLPKLIGTYPGTTSGVQVVGTTAYLANAASGLTIINVEKPNNPTFVGSYDTPGAATGVQVVGTTAYVADGNSGLQIITRLNRLNLSGNSSVLDRSNYMVTIEGTTPTGITSTSFALSVGGNLAPLYQNPISTQKAMVNENFKYVMPDNVFVDPNADLMTYKAQGLPLWLVFDAGKRTFFGKPTPGDTGTFADFSTALSIIASDGRVETRGQFTVTVIGESYLAKVMKVVGPTLSAFGMLYSGYKNRALILDTLAKKKWKSNHIHVRLGEHFIYELKTEVKDIRKVQAYVRDKKRLGKMYEKIFCGSQRYAPMVVTLPSWMDCNTEVNTLFSIRQLTELDLMGYRNMQIRVLGNGNVIKEILHLTLEGEAPTINGTFDSFTRLEQEQIGLMLFPLTNTTEMEGPMQLQVR